LLTAFPVEQDAWMEMGADRMLVKPMQTPVLIRQLEKLLESHAAKLAKISSAAAPRASEAKVGSKKSPAKRAEKKLPAKRAVAKKAVRRTGKKKS
jgi:DNA-binding response OmpR family regulator